MKYSFLAASVFALSNQDFVDLKASLKQFILQDGERNIPIIVRMSFHDIIGGGLGPHGCLKLDAILNAEGNAGLSDKVKELSAFVAERFPKTDFTFGDVMSLAGKTAIELAYPCMKIKWKYGRAKCTATQNLNQLPHGTLNQLSQMKAFLDIYKLTHKEMAVLVAGSHGLAKASASNQNSGFGGIMSEINSGKDWIVKSFGSWVGTLAPNGAAQWTAGTILRITSDMIYFPSVLHVTGGFADDSGKPIEDYMRTFVDQDRSVFDAEFAKAYAKMLEIGTSGDTLTAFDDQDKLGVCTDSGPPPSVPLHPSTTSTTAVITSTATAEPTTTANTPEITSSAAQSSILPNATTAKTTATSTLTQTAESPGSTDPPTFSNPDGTPGGNGENPGDNTPPSPYGSNSEPDDLIPIFSSAKRATGILSVFLASLFL